MSEHPQPGISFVVITYNDAGRLPRCLVSAALAASASGLDHEILVVDNGSTDHTRPLLEAFGQVLGGRLKTIYLGRNTGTTFSRNRALEASRGRMICVMDSDAEILDLDLRPVLRLLQDFPEVGIVGPAIIMPDGSTYNSVKRLPTLADKLLKLPGILLRRPTINHDWYPGFPFAHTRCVQTAISCCWFLTRDTWQRVGPLDERIFYAPEDVDYCLRAWKAGRAVVFYPHLRVKHHTRHITHKKPFSATSLSHLKGLVYYLHKHGYWLSRRRLVEGTIRPLARVLDLRLARWEAAP
ncbi:MAG: glycosyltransferase [Desulfarculus sp.]|nr:glycosyltransferase [Desulfarculus sp.]